MIQTNRRDSISKLAGEAGPAAQCLRVAGLYYEAALLDGLAELAREFRDTFEPAADDDDATEKKAGKRGPDTKPRRKRGDAAADAAAADGKQTTIEEAAKKAAAVPAPASGGAK